MPQADVHVWGGVGMKAGCYLIFVRNEATGCLRLAATGNPQACVEKMENMSGCDMSIVFQIGYLSVEEATERKDVMKVALAPYKIKAAVNGKKRSRFGSWFLPEAWGHLAVAPEVLEEAVEELYNFYDGELWMLQDSLPV